MNKTLSALTLFIVAVVSYGLSYLIGGVIGEAFGLVGLICLVLSVIRFISEMVNKKKQAKVPQK
jgi:hypothetical protein